MATSQTRLTMVMTVERIQNRRHFKITKRVVAAIVIIGVLASILLVMHTSFLTWYLPRLGPANRAAVPYAHGQLTSFNPLVRAAAARGLGNIGPAAAVAAPDLVNALHDNSPQVAAAAADALGRIQPPQQAVLDGLSRALDHNDGEVRRYAAVALSRYGPKAASTVPELAMKLEDKHMGYLAARALGEIGGPARDSIPQITELLSSTHWHVRSTSASALTNLVPLDDDTVSKLEVLLRDDNAHVRKVAERALLAISKQTSQPDEAQ